MKFAINAISVLGLIALAVWWYEGRGPEQGGSFLLALAGYLTWTGAEYRKRVDPKRKADRALFALLLTELPYEPAIAMCRTFDFGGSFRPKDIADLDDFYHRWQAPDRTFHDPRTATALSELICEVRAFNSLLALNTFPVSASAQGFPPEWGTSKAGRERLEQVRGQLNDAASKVATGYSRFVQVAKDRLGT